MADATKSKDSPEVVNLKEREQELTSILATHADGAVRKRKENQLKEIKEQLAELAKR